ncbi:SAM-dependent methyltransferase [Prosthecochloris sp. CIB 2401]|uniref:SAM-dependent methyltransferase n=1 Tax=Prosthecochloris sp. CIB 2401 TaxID=1868325 RepID=UPI00080AC143|nr:SAM-dependent methyltransferase [Prosthecochloris sp. CIB 2401]ANT65728.1 methyltransferase [Prosthecochloris sp. CIB 2401]
MNTAFLLHSIEAWEQDRKERFNLSDLTSSFHESVPALGFIDWQITAVERGYAETLLPLAPNSSNQYIAHQGPLMLLAAEYTGGLALTSLFHLVPIIGFWPSVDDNAGYMWGAKASIKWFAPSCHNLTCKARIEPEKWEGLAKRFAHGNKVAATIPIEMYNGEDLMARAEFTYWAQNLTGLKRHAFDVDKIDILYAHKTQTTAKLIVGLRAMEQEKPVEQRRFDDPYAIMLAGKHGITLAKRFSIATPQLQNMIAARTQDLDTELLSFSQTVDTCNVINIGAGYDSRLWRLHIDNAIVYDLDLPIMLNERRKSLDDNNRNTIHSIAIDLENHSIHKTLMEQSHYNADLPTFIIWEGGSMYFTPGKIDQILADISNLMRKKSLFWFDYVSEDLVNCTTGIREVEGFITNIRKMGEPFINGYNNIETLANRHRLSVQKNICSGDTPGLKEEIYRHYSFCLLKKDEE